MELTPHIKALFEDLLKLTSKIVVKRPDTATENDNENNLTNLELFGAYRDIVNGEESVSSYGTLPKEVLKKLISWTQIDNTDLFKKCLPGSGHFTNGTIEQYYDYSAPKPSNQLPAGTLWVEKIGRERYAKLYVDSGAGKKSSFSLHVGADILNEIPIDLDLSDSDGNSLIAYFNEYYTTIPEDGDELEVYDGYGNQINYITSEKYIYSEETDQYIIYTDEIAPNGGHLYYRAYVYGFYYADPIVIETDVYMTKDEYYANRHQYEIQNTSGTYMQHDGEYIDVMDIDPSEYDIYGDKEPYYRCNKVLRNSNIAYTDSSDEVKFGEINTSSINTDIRSMYYFIESESGKYIYDGTEYVLDTVTTNVYRYKKVSADTDIDRYEFIDGEYTLSPTGDYTYVCDDCIYYIAQKVTDDSELKNTKLITELDRDFWPAAQIAMRQYVIDNYCPTVDPEEHRVSLYLGETNPYYRMLNGLPDMDKMETALKIDRRLVNPSYDDTAEGANLNPYIYELTDQEVERLEEIGELRRLQNLYPKYEYLNYLGRDRIDVIVARDAKPFDILRMADVENSKHIELFRKSYFKSRDYILHRFYNPEIFQEFDHYVGYIGFLIMTHAICQCLGQSDDILVYDQYSDDTTINNILESYGYGGTFAELPSIYRKMLAKNILMLIKYRGTDEIYKIIYNICGITKYNIFKYDIINNDDALNVIKNSVIDHKIDDSKQYSFEDLINGDDLWKAGAEVVKALNFSKSSSKYIDMETYFDLAELTLNNSFLLNYLMDVSKTRDVPIDIPNLGIFQLYDLIIGLFAIQSIKFGYSGTIPNTVAASASVYKLNLRQHMDGDNEARSILERYKMQVTGVARENIIHLLDILNSSGSLVLPDETDVTVRSFADGYFKSIQKDSPGTNLNENSFYQEILELRSKTKNIDEYRCYNELLDCIATAALTVNNFALDTPIWEPIFAGTYTGDLLNYSKLNYSASRWAYGEDLSMLMPGITDTSNYVADTVTETMLTDGHYLYTANSVPSSADDVVSPSNTSYFLQIQESADAGVYEVTLYQKCYTALTYTMYIREQCPELYNKIFEVTTDDTYVINAYDTVFSINAAFIKIIKDGSRVIIDLGDNSNYTLLDIENDGDIDVIVLKDATSLTYAQYYEILKSNADRIYKLIISKIESMLSSDQVRRNLVLSHESIANVIGYLELLIEVFKSYNTDIRRNDVIYTLEEDSKNAVRLFDTVSFDLTTSKREDIGIYDSIEFIFD